MAIVRRSFPNSWWTQTPTTTVRSLWAIKKSKKNNGMPCHIWSGCRMLNVKCCVLVFPSRRNFNITLLFSLSLLLLVVVLIVSNDLLCSLQSLLFVCSNRKCADESFERNGKNIKRNWKFVRTYYWFACIIRARRLQYYSKCVLICIILIFNLWNLLASCLNDKTI